MKTPTQMKTSSASDCGITPSATLSATAFATACCAGPNICTACLAPLIVTLLNRTVAGLHSRFGPTTARSDVKPSLLLVRACANADSAALPRGPMMRSMWATSLPSPTSDSPTQSPLMTAMAISLARNFMTLHYRAGKFRGACLVYPCCQRPAGSAGPVSQIAAETGPAGVKSITVATGRQDELQAAAEQGCHRKIGGGARIYAPRLKGSIPRQEFAKESRRLLRRPQQRIKFRCRPAHLSRNLGAVFAHDMAVGKPG